jgi:glycosyltransferase involved in cell wall biosynthesis
MTLTGVERALWRLARMDPGAGAWNEPFAVYLTGRLSVPDLTRALHRVVGRHPALRTRFPAPDGEPVATVVPAAEVALDIPVRGPGHGLWPDELRAAAGAPFDLSRELPIRAAVLRYLGMDTLLLVLHRLAGDRWTAGLVYRELAAAYQATTVDGQVPPPAGPAPPSGSAAGFWREQLSGADPAAAALTVGRPGPETLAGAMYVQPLGPAAHQAVRRLARDLRTEPGTVLLAGHLALLAYHGAGPGPVVAVASPATATGWRSDPLPIRHRVDLAGSFAALVAGVRDRLAGAVAHRPAPWEVLEPDPGEGGAGWRDRLVRHRFDHHPAADLPPLGGSAVDLVPVDTGYSRYDLEFAVHTGRTRIVVQARYRTDRFAPDDVRALVQRYDALLCRAGTAPDRPLAELDWWTSADRAVAAGGRMAILAGRAFPGSDGMSMRWQALRAALGRHTRCELREIECNRREECATACRLTGQPPADDGAPDWTDGQVWFFDRRFCRAYADRLAGELVAAGVSTVVCSGLATNRYVPVLAAVPGLTVVFDMHNVELALHRAIHEAAPPGSYHATIYDEHHLRLVEAAERAAVAAAGRLWVCSPAERDLVTSLYGEPTAGRITVVPNVLDVPGGAPPPAGCARICYPGRLNYYPNLDAGTRLAYEIAPLLRARGHDVPVVIAGEYARELLGGPSLPRGVELVSEPASIPELIAGGIMAVPLAVGGGTRYKILEAFRYGAPVVSTAKGIEGLAAVPGEHYLPAETPPEFAAALDALLRDPALRARIAGAAWRLARGRYSIDALARQLARAVPALVGAGGPAR